MANKVPLPSSSPGSLRGLTLLITIATMKFPLPLASVILHSFGFLHRSPKVPLKLYLYEYRSTEASCSLIPVALKFLIYSLPQSKRLSLNDHMHENDSEAFILLLSCKLHLNGTHPHPDVLPSPQIQHVPKQTHAFPSVPLLLCGLRPPVFPVL